MTQPNNAAQEELRQAVLSKLDFLRADQSLRVCDTILPLIEAADSRREREAYTKGYAAASDTGMNVPKIVKRGKIRVELALLSDLEKASETRLLAGFPVDENFVGRYIDAKRQSLQERK